MEGVVDYLGEGVGGGDVVGDPADGDAGTGGTLDVLPLSAEADEAVGGGAVVEKLGHEVEVGDKGGLEDDGHVGGVEELRCGVCGVCGVCGWCVFGKCVGLVNEFLWSRGVVSVSR